MTEHDVLVAAKSYLLNSGWCRHRLGGHGGPACLRGALYAAVDHARCCDGRRSADRLLCDLIDGRNMPRWNDDEDRTFDDVIALLDRAILATAPATVDEPEPALA